MASGKIKGITVEIGGDTTKLGKAIGDSEKKTRSLQVELKQVQKMLKLDPNNIELLTQKQKILTDSVDETGKKLQTLKEAEAQVVAQFESGKIGEDQLRAFQREIIQTQNNLNQMESELQQVSSDIQNFSNANDDASESVEEHEKKLEEANKTLEEFKGKAEGASDKVKTGALAIGAATVAGAGYALKLTTEFDQAFNTLATKTGATSDEFDSLRESMENVYANNLGESMEDVAESMATVKNNTQLTGEELQKTTEYALLMRETFGFEVEESTRSAQMMMKQFGLTSEEAYNYIAQGAQNGLDKNGDLLDTINEYSVHFQQLGLDADDMFNMLLNGTEAGTFSVDKLGDAVKEFGIRVKDGTADDAFKTLGLNVDETKKKFGQGGDSAKQALQDVTKALFDMEDPIKQNELGVQMFGTMWEDLGVDGVKALMNLDGKISSSTDALKQINDMKYSDIGSALQGLGRTVQTDLIAPIGEELRPFIVDAITYIQSHSDEIQNILSAIVDGVGDFVNFVVSNGPMILSVIAGIGTGFLLWNVVSMITGVVEAIKAFKLANEGASIAQLALNLAMNANPIGILITVIGGIIVAIATFIATNENARAKFIEIWNKIKETLSGVVDGIVNFFTVTIPNVLEQGVSFFTSIPGKIYSALSGVITQIQAWGSSLLSAGKSVILAFINGIITLTITLPLKFYTSIFGVIAKVVSWGANLIKIARAQITKMIAAIIIIAKSLPGKLYDAIVGAINKVKTWGSTLGNVAGSAMKKVLTTIVNVFKSVPSKFKQIGSDIINGIKNGIAAKASALYNQIKDTMSTAVNKAKSFLKIKSPSRLWKDEVGKQIPAGAAAGVDENAFLVENSIDSMARKLAGFEVASSKPNTKVGLSLTSTSENVNKMPQMATFNLQVDGKTLGQIVAPFLDVINGTRINLTERGVIV